MYDLLKVFQLLYQINIETWQYKYKFIFTDKSCPTRVETTACQWLSAKLQYLQCDSSGDTAV